MTFLGETEHFSGKNGALRWSILVGKQKHNVQKPNSQAGPAASLFWNCRICLFAEKRNKFRRTTSNTYLINRLLLNDKRKSYNFVLANEFSFQKTKRERIENWEEFCTQGQIHDFMKGEIRRQGHGVLQQEMLKIWLWNKTELREFSSSHSVACNPLTFPLGSTAPGTNMFFFLVKDCLRLQGSGEDVIYWYVIVKA